MEFVVVISFPFWVATNLGTRTLELRPLYMLNSALELSLDSRQSNQFVLYTLPAVSFLTTAIFHYYSYALGHTASTPPINVSALSLAWPIPIGSSDSEAGPCPFYAIRKSLFGYLGSAYISLVGVKGVKKDPYGTGRGCR